MTCYQMMLNLRGANPTLQHTRIMRTRDLLILESLVRSPITTKGSLKGPINDYNQHVCIPLHIQQRITAIHPYLCPIHQQAPGSHPIPLLINRHSCFLKHRKQQKKDQTCLCDDFISSNLIFNIRTEPFQFIIPRAYF